MATTTQTINKLRGLRWASAANLCANLCCGGVGTCQRPHNAMISWRTQHDSNVRPLPSEGHSGAHVRLVFAVFPPIRSRYAVFRAADLVRAHKMPHPHDTQGGAKLGSL